MADSRLTGRINKVNGALFEQIISASCAAYKEEGVAFIEKTPEPFHITGKGANGIVHGYYEKAAQPDYKGILDGGMGIMFEAKHTDTDRIMQSVVTENQRKNLDVYHALGAKCFVLVSMGFEGFYRVPWMVWKQMKELFKHKYMNIKELSPYEVKWNGQRIFFLGDTSEESAAAFLGKDSC